MANKILKRTSFGLIRTNPRLSTNVKLVADSSDKLYLESIDSNPILSSSLYKGYEVQTDYAQDLHRFFNQGGVIPKNLLYEVYEEDGAISVKDRYKFQRDFTYALGSYPKNSKLYTEEFAAFAPLWLERDNIPDYFLIFRMDGPVTKNINTAEYANVDKDTDPALDELIKNPDLFFSNYIQKAKIVAQFDLTNNTNIGSYLRRHVNDPEFPESPLYFSPEEGDLTYWQGISLDEGGFTKKSEPINTDYVLPDKTVVESEDFITFGFSRNSIVCANLINMEFLFDDAEQEDYKFYRYFGMYVSEQQLGQFTIDPDKLYADRFVENSQTPTPIIPNVGDPTLAENQIQSNVKGVKVYPNIISGSTGIYSGRLLTWEETQRSRFGYLKDTANNLYSIDNTYNWVSEYQNPGSTSAGDTYTDSAFLRVKDTTVNWAAFGGFQEPFSYVTTFQNGLQGSANFAFDVLKSPSGNDQIRIKYTDPTTPKASTKITTGSTFKTLVDEFTVRGSSALSAGTNDGNVYSTQGTNDQIASAIVKAINNISKIINRDVNSFGEEIVFEAVSQGPKVIVYYKNASEIFNNVEFSIFANVAYVEDIPYSRPSTLADWVQESYLASPIYTPTGATFNAPQMGFVYTYKFVGGNTKPRTRFVIEKGFVDNFLDQTDKTYVKTDKGYSTVVYEYSNYLDSPLYKGADIIGFTDIDKYYVLSITKKDNSLQIGSEGKLPLRKLRKNSVGYLSIMPIRDFDFDFFNEEYNRDGDASLTQLYDWELGKGVIGTGFVAGTYAGATSLLVTTKNTFTDENLYTFPTGADSQSLRVVFAKSATGGQGMTGAVANLHEIYSTVDGGDNWNLVYTSPNEDITDIDWLSGDKFVYAENGIEPAIRRFDVTPTGGTLDAYFDLTNYPDFRINTIAGINEREVIFAGSRTYPENTYYPAIIPYNTTDDVLSEPIPRGRWVSIGSTAIAPITTNNFDLSSGGFGIYSNESSTYNTLNFGNAYTYNVRPYRINPFNFCQLGVSGASGDGTAADMPIWTAASGDTIGIDSQLGSVLFSESYDPTSSPEIQLVNNLTLGASAIFSYGTTANLISPFTAQDGRPIGPVSFYNDGTHEMLITNILNTNYNLVRQGTTGVAIWNTSDLVNMFTSNQGLSPTNPAWMTMVGGLSVLKWDPTTGPTGGTLTVDTPTHSIFMYEQTGAFQWKPGRRWEDLSGLDIGLIGPTQMTFDYRYLDWDPMNPPPGVPGYSNGFGLPNFDGATAGEVYLQNGYGIGAIDTPNSPMRSIYHVWQWNGAQWRRASTSYDWEGHILQTTPTFNGNIWFGITPKGGIESTFDGNGGTLYSWDEIRGIQILYYFRPFPENGQPRGALIDDPSNPGFNKLIGMGTNGPWTFNLQHYYGQPIPPNFLQPLDPGQFQSMPNGFFSTSGLYGYALGGGLSIGPSAQPNRLHSVSRFGGDANRGLVWSVDCTDVTNPTNYKVEATFNGPNGAYPAFAPFRGPSGFIYGDASLGGTNGGGNLYKLDPVGSTGQIWYYNFNTTDLHGLTGSGTLFSDFDGDAEYVSISARRGPTFHYAGNSVVALANYSPALVSTYGPSAGPWIYGSKFTNSTTLSTWYQPMGPTGSTVGGTSGGYFRAFNRVKNFPWLGSTANPDYYVISGTPYSQPNYGVKIAPSITLYSHGATAILISRGITGFSPITDYGIIKPIPSSTISNDFSGFFASTDVNGPAYSSFAFENDFGLLSLWTLTPGGNLLNTVIGTTSIDVDWGNIQLPGATNPNSTLGVDLEVYPTEIPLTNPFVQWWALSQDSKTAISNAIGPDSPFSITGGFQRLTGLYNEFNDTADIIGSEYARLKENDNPILSVYSRVVPFINKWVYDNESTDVRENGYRLNVDQAFGMFNFSPSFDEYSRNPKLFTHEWYYLQEYPEYMTFDEKRNSFSYFDTAIVNPTGPTGDYSTYTGITGSSGGGLFSVVDDYFVEYFTRETVEGNPIPRDFKYSIFNGGSDLRFAETLFRGAKVAIKDRSGTAKVDYNVEEIKTLPSAEYDDYKFSAVLTYGESTAIKAIKNDKWKTVTVLIEAELNDPLLTNYNGDRWIDRAYLYSANDIYSYPGYGGQFQYADIIIKGSINGWADTGEYFEIYTGTDINGELTDFSNDMTLNDQGGFNSIYLSNTVGSVTYIYKFGGIFDISTRSFKCRTIEGLPLNSTLTPTGFNSYVNIRNAWPGSVRADYAKPFQPQIGSRIYYEFGGYNAYDNILTSISFASIADAFNSGDPHVQYIQVNEDGTVEFNTFMLSMLPPDDLVKASYLDIAISEDKPSGLQSSVDIGFELVGAPRVELSKMYRYRGEYTPKWYDIIKFVDETDLKDEGLEYLNINIWDVQRGGSGSTASPYYYWKDDTIGIIPNLYLYKVNVENPNIVGGQNITGSTRRIYPAIGEISIDKKDFFVFRSNWDPYYYWKYLKRNISQPVIGTREPKEEKAFFGSKVIAIPDNPVIEKFDGGAIDREIFGRKPSKIKTIKEDLVFEIAATTKKQNQLIVDIYVTGALSKWLIAEGFGAEFTKYIDPNYSFDQKTIDDDVTKYIEENIFDRYEISNITFWEKSFQSVSDEPLIRLDYTDAEKIANGYVTSTNFQTIPLGNNPLNFSLIYNLPTDKQVSISCTVTLNKK